MAFPIHPGQLRRSVPLWARASFFRARHVRPHIFPHETVFLDTKLERLDFIRSALLQRSACIRRCCLFSLLLGRPHLVLGPWVVWACAVLCPYLGLSSPCRPTLVHCFLDSFSRLYFYYFRSNWLFELAPRCCCSLECSWHVSCLLFGGGPRRRWS